MVGEEGKGAVRSQCWEGPPALSHDPRSIMPHCALTSAHALRCPRAPSSAPTAPATRSYSAARARTLPAPLSASGSERCCPRGEGVGRGTGAWQDEGLGKRGEEVLRNCRGLFKRRDLALDPRPVVGEETPRLCPFQSRPRSCLIHYSGLTLACPHLLRLILNPRVPPHPLCPVHIPWADPAWPSDCVSLN